MLYISEVDVNITWTTIIHINGQIIKQINAEQKELQKINLDLGNTTKQLCQNAVGQWMLIWINISTDGRVFIKRTEIEIIHWYSVATRAQTYLMTLLTLLFKTGMR